MIEKQVGPIAYHLKLLSAMRRLYPVFNVVKLTSIPNDPISSRCPSLLPDLILINGQEEWEIEEILNSFWY